MSKKVFINIKYLCFGLFLFVQFSCRDTGSGMGDYEVELIADSAANSFIGGGRLDIFMQLSSDIVKARLENYGFSAEDYELEVADNRLKIKVYNLVRDSTGKEARSIEPVMLLATSQGSFRIYETFDNIESKIIFARIDSAMSANDAAASVYDHLMVPEYYEDGEVVYHPTPVVGYVANEDTGKIINLVKQYSDSSLIPDDFNLMPLFGLQNNLRGMVAIRREYRDSALPLIDQSYISKVNVRERGNSTVFRIQLNETGRELFTMLSLDNENRSLAITLDGKVIFYPRLSALITDGVLEFSSGMPMSTARALAIVINMKQLPLNMKIKNEMLLKL